MEEDHNDHDFCSSISEEDDDHKRTIIHLDIDCFYAQVEMLNDPSLREKPLGIQQKNIVVTCNYVARERGVGKCQYIAEAMTTCPDLVLVNGEEYGCLFFNIFLEPSSTVIWNNVFLFFNHPEAFYGVLKKGVTI